MTDQNPRYADDCDRCCARKLRTVAEPLLAIPDGDGMVAAYRCPTCAHTWTTAWALVPGRVLPTQPTGCEPLHLRDLAARLSEENAIGRARRLLRRNRGEAA